MQLLFFILKTLKQILIQTLYDHNGKYLLSAHYLKATVLSASHVLTCVNSLDLYNTLSLLHKIKRDQSYCSRKWHSEDFKLGNLTPEPKLLNTSPYFFLSLIIITICKQNSLNLHMKLLTNQRIKSYISSYTE